jgi:hypothetical protein
MLIAILGGALVLGLIGLGIFIGQAGNGASITPVKPEPTNDCDKLCADWSLARSQHCLAEADTATAKARADSLSDQRNGYLVAAGIATAAAIASLFIPFIGAAVAAGLFAAAAVLAASALLLLGAAIAAHNDFLAKSGIERAAAVIEAAARNDLLTKCHDKALSCLSTPSPC